MKKSLALAFSLGMLLSISSPMHADGGTWKLGLGLAAFYGALKLRNLAPGKKLKAWLKTDAGTVATAGGTLVVCGLIHAMTRTKKTD